MASRRRPAAARRRPPWPGVTARFAGAASFARAAKRARKSRDIPPRRRRAGNRGGPPPASEAARPPKPGSPTRSGARWGGQPRWGPRQAMFPSSIRNLVPACGKCNQSKGNKDWRSWIRSGAKWSPVTRGKQGLDERVRRLGAFEAWAQCEPVDIASLVPPTAWEGYWRLLDDLLERMEEADATAAEIARATRAQRAAAKAGG